MKHKRSVNQEEGSSHRCKRQRKTEPQSHVISKPFQLSVYVGSTLLDYQGGDIEVVTSCFYFKCPWSAGLESSSDEEEPSCRMRQTRLLSQEEGAVVLLDSDSDEEGNMQPSACILCHGQIKLQSSRCQPLSAFRLRQCEAELDPRPILMSVTCVTRTS